MKKMKIAFVCKRKLKRLLRKKFLITPDYIKLALSYDKLTYSIGTNKLYCHADMVVFVRHELLRVFKNTLSDINFTLCNNIIRNNEGFCYVREFNNPENKSLRRDVSIFFVYNSERNFLKAKMKS